MMSVFGCRCRRVIALPLVPTEEPTDQGQSSQPSGRWRSGQGGHGRRAGFFHVVSSLTIVCRVWVELCPFPPPCSVGYPSRWPLRWMRRHRGWWWHHSRWNWRPCWPVANGGCQWRHWRTRRPRYHDDEVVQQQPRPRPQAGLWAQTHPRTSRQIEPVGHDL